jgi:hypothetical protein
VRQQINLYQPLFRPGRTALPARSVLQLLVIFTVGLLAVWLFDAWRVHRLEREVLAMEARQADQSALLQAVGDARAYPSSIDLKPQWQQTHDQLAQHRQALATLNAGAAGTRSGFAAALASLARHHIDGIWLEHVRFSNGGRLQALEGTALDADLVPRYLHSLAGESVLRGTQIDDFRIDRSEGIDGSGAEAASTTANAASHATAGAIRGVRFRAHHGVETTEGKS